MLKWYLTFDLHIQINVRPGPEAIMHDVYKLDCACTGQTNTELFASGGRRFYEDLITSSRKEKEENNQDYIGSIWF